MFFSTNLIFKVKKIVQQESGDLDKVERVLVQKENVDYLGAI